MAHPRLGAAQPVVRRRSHPGAARAGARPVRPRTDTNIRGILFDKDGTLLDFDATWPPAYRAIANDLAALAGDPGLAARLLAHGGYGTDGSLDPASVLAGGTTAEIVAFWAARPELARLPDVARRIEAMFLDHARRAAPLTDDLGALLGTLRKRGLALGIATNDNAEAATAWLDHLGLTDFFAFVSGADSGYGAKPDPAALHAFCAATNLAPANVAVVGDAVRDMDFARAAGAGLSVAVLTGVTPRAQLEPHADRVIETVAGLEAILG